MKRELQLGKTETPASGDASPPTSKTTASSESRWRVILSFLLLASAIQLIAGPKIRLSQWTANADSNAAVAEGVAWLHGRIDLPPVRHGAVDWSYRTPEGDPADPAARQHDTAYFQNRRFNVFPPLMALLTVALSPLHRILGVPSEMWMSWELVYLIFWPLVMTGFIVFRRRVGDSIWAAVLTMAWICGSAVLPNLHFAQGGQLAQIYHVASQIGLLILADDVLGKQRIWPGLIGLCIATYTRQLTFLYEAVLLVVAARRYHARGVVFCAIGLLLISAPLLILNHAKFGNPLEFGYRHIYVGREDGQMGERCIKYGVFSPHFIPDNLYYLFVAPPRIADASPTNIQIEEDNNFGTSLWITTPLALWALVSAPQWWRDRKTRLLMLGTLPVLAGILCYHSPGYLELGYSRFALDFLPIWLVVAGPFMRGGWRTWVSLGLIAWSLLYFQSIVPNVPLLRSATVRVAPIKGDEWPSLNRSC